MNALELKLRLEKMNAAEKEAFNKAVGISGFDNERILDMFVKEAAWEKKVCHVLNEPTEADKAIQATLQQAKDQRRSVRISWIALAVAIVLGTASLIVSIIAICK